MTLIRGQVITNTPLCHLLLPPRKWECAFPVQGQVRPLPGALLAVWEDAISISPSPTPPSLPIQKHWRTQKKIQGLCFTDPPLTSPCSESANICFQQLETKKSMLPPNTKVPLLAIQTNECIYFNDEHETLETERGKKQEVLMKKCKP